jgi:hypothetical protein
MCSRKGFTYVDQIDHKTCANNERVLDIGAIHTRRVGAGNAPVHRKSPRLSSFAVTLDAVQNLRRALKPVLAESSALFAFIIGG